MKLFGIIGKPLDHSFSPKYFKGKFLNENLKDYDYKLFPLDEIEDLPNLIKSQPDLVGLNVTSPYKESVVQFTEKVSRDAKLLGAINTIKIKRHEGQFELEGFNTDVFGFESALMPRLKDKKPKALIIGTGGAAKAVTYVLMKNGINCVYITRRPLKSNHIIYWAVNKEVMADHELIINTTPMGMNPQLPPCPDLPYRYLSPDHILIDLIYNPAKTKFLEYGEKAGATTINGMEMFKKQADKSWEIWNKK
jgi:shikimate dehydrogenase